MLTPVPTSGSATDIIYINSESSCCHDDSHQVSIQHIMALEDMSFEELQDGCHGGLISEAEWNDSSKTAQCLPTWFCRCLLKNFKMTAILDIRTQPLPDQVL